MILKALVLNDYADAPYATLVYQGRKKIETRMGRVFSHRGPIIICCGKTNSVGVYAGLAMCIVDIFDAGPMLKTDEEQACIEWHPSRKSFYLRNWQYFNRMFAFSECKVGGSFQAIFDVQLPSDIILIPQPQITQAVKQADAQGTINDFIKF